MASPVQFSGAIGGSEAEISNGLIDAQSNSNGHDINNVVDRSTQDVDANATVDGGGKGPEIDLKADSIHAQESAENTETSLVTDQAKEQDVVSHVEIVTEQETSVLPEISSADAEISSQGEKIVEHVLIVSADAPPAADSTTEVSVSEVVVSEVQTVSPPIIGSVSAKLDENVSTSFIPACVEISGENVAPANSGIENDQEFDAEKHSNVLNSDQSNLLQTATQLSATSEQISQSSTATNSVSVPSSLPSDSTITLNAQEEISSLTPNFTKKTEETVDVDADIEMNGASASVHSSPDVVAGVDTEKTSEHQSSVKRDMDRNSAEPLAKRPRVAADAIDGIYSVEKTQEGTTPPVTIVSHEKPTVVGSDLPLRNGSSVVPQTNGMSASRPNNGNGMYIDTRVPSDAPSSNVPMSRDQQRFLLNLVKTLKKQKAAIYFLHPVDAHALGIPHYFNIIKKPSDLGTVDRNLTASKPGTPNAPYISVHDVVTDMDLIWNNSDTFNGPDHQVSQMGHQIRDSFRKNFRNLPPAFSVEPVKSAISSNRKPSGNGHPQTPKSATDSRPKRETHAPVKSVINYDEKPPRSSRKKSSSGFLSDEQTQFCKSVLSELHKTKHSNYAYPFLEPVDPIALGIPHYKKIITHPMDLLTMRNKLENGVYKSLKEFEDDFRLIISNCHEFNPAGTEVAQAGLHLKAAFMEKWRQLPTRSSGNVQESDSEEENPVNGGRPSGYTFIKEQMEAYERDMNKLGKDSPAYSMLEQQVVKLRADLAVLKPAKKPSKQQQPPTRKAATYHPPPPAVARPPKQPKTPRIEQDDEIYEPVSKSKSKPSKKKKAHSDSDEYLDEHEEAETIKINTEISYSQKEELATKINRLDDIRLAEAIKIIQEGTNLDNDREEIELDIDILPPATLFKLYSYVVGKPAKARPKKPRAPGMVKKTGTGGLKRSVMDEDIASQEIRDMQAKLAAFDSNPTAPPTPVTESNVTSQTADAQSMFATNPTPPAGGSEIGSDDDDAVSASSISD